MSSGYLMFDLSEVDWSDEGDQILPRVYERAKEVYNSGCLVLVSADSGGVIPGYVSKSGNRYIVNGYLTGPYTITINPEDTISISVE